MPARDRRRGHDDGDARVVAVRRAHGWAYVAVLLAGAVVVAVLPPGPWQPAAEVGVYLLGVTAVRRGLRRNRPAAGLGWRLLAAALGAFALSSAAEAAEFAGITPGVNSAAESGLDVAGHGSSQPRPWPRSSPAEDAATRRRGRTPSRCCSPRAWPW